MVAWPDALVTEFAERRGIVVMGAGASMAAGDEEAEGIPGWSDLLDTMAESLLEDADADECELAIKEGRLLDAGEVLRSRANAADFRTELQGMLQRADLDASPIHEAIHALDPHVVVTTNFDQLYERYCQTGQGAYGYSVCKHYEAHAIDEIRSPKRLILKAHGCVSEPSKAVLSRGDYFRARRDNPEFYAILDALFLTNTLLFVGYSLSDPDIQLVLENSNIAAPSNHAHYALMPDGLHESIKEVYKETYNVTLLEYDAGDGHDQAAASLQELADRVVAARAENPA